ncbi:MUC5B protein, partial [Atlantisia rogersi]|nr:MUC5B protein [Atlantisia rogersi]
MATTIPVTTVCVKNVCTWSDWYDSTQPENREDSGDYETFAKLREKGYSVCNNPRSVQCRAKEHPDTEITNLNQTVQCSQSEGLICNNKDQQSKYCYNYEIRVSCCSYMSCSEIETTTPRTTEELTTAVTSTPFTLRTKIPTTQKKETEAQRTEVPTISPTATESTTPLTETSVTAKTTTGSTKGTTAATTVALSTTRSPREGTTISLTTTTTTAPTSAASSTSTTGITTPSTTTSAATSVPAETSTLATQPTTSLSKTTVSCQQHCEWTQWFDLDNPSPGSENGDIETFAKIRAAGYALCEEPQDIRCRAKDYPDRTPEQLGQIVECSLKNGLVCRNKDQITKYPMCFNYEMQVQCCDIKKCQTSPAPGTTAGSSTTVTPAETTTIGTQTQAPSTTASTLPQTATTTTAGTTVVLKTATPKTQVTTNILSTSRASTSQTSPAPTEATTIILP